MWFEFPNIDPVAFYLGPMPIRWYALAYLVGFLAGWQYCLYLCDLNQGRRPNKADIDDFLPWAILGVIVGGRVGYVLFYQAEFYAHNPLEAFKVWNGGMSFHGGVIGTITAMVCYSYAQKFSLLRLSDLLACAAPIGLLFGRLANFINGELFGRVTDMPWGIVFPWGGDLPRHPSQIYEAILEGFILFCILFVLVRFQTIRNREGLLAGVFLLGYGLSRVFVEFFREPDLELGFIVDIFTMGQVLSVPMVLAGIVLIFMARERKDDHSS